jgi:hypothetical protein
MRLADSATGVIRETAERVFGSGVLVWLFAEPIDAAWVTRLSDDDERSERVEAFAAR